MIKKIINIIFIVALIVGTVIIYQKINNSRVAKNYLLKDGTRVRLTLQWGKDGNLISRTSEFKGKLYAKNVGYFKSGQYVTIDGQKYLMQEMDFSRSKLLGKHSTEKFVIYSKDKQIIFSENDKNGDGIIDSKSKYKDNMIIETVSLGSKDGKFDIWTYYENGNPIRSEYDSNGDGKPDKQGLPPMDYKHKVTRAIGDV